MIDDVNRTVQILDKIEPKWKGRINWKKLDLCSGRWCVLGQVFGSYHIGLDRFKASQFNDLEPWKYGLSLRWFEDNEKNRLKLHNTWIYVLKGFVKKPDFKRSNRRKSNEQKSTRTTVKSS